MRYFDCGQCGGKCCKFIVLPAKKLDGDAAAYFGLRGRIMDTKRFGRMLVLDIPCKNLTEGGKCRDYENRPDLCREMDEYTLHRYCVPNGCKYDLSGKLGEDFGV